ncbi:MAG TPA: TetR/AcrR family transcriptional regulator [Solirubrobacteraceae bacterium]|jgi:AcrR family transcriptional regulator|nr:TetR/AcrR family transcriptional regulator [Solirubrobacteraceae bacterium]
MAAPAAPRSRRDRPAKPALSREAIVDAALAIARKEGIDALTMRRLAQALDTGPASLYVYVANREELYALLFDAAVANVEVEPVDPARWREQLKALSWRVVRTMVEDYPGLAQLAMSHIPSGENAMRIAESMLALLKAGGASDQTAAYAADFMSTYLNAIAYEQSMYRRLYSDPDHQQHEVERVAEAFATLDPERFPTIAALGPAMTRGDERERFELGLDVIINGLLATPAEGRLT